MLQGENEGQSSVPCIQSTRAVPEGCASSKHFTREGESLFPSPEALSCAGMGGALEGTENES